MAVRENPPIAGERFDQSDAHLFVLVVSQGGLPFHFEQFGRELPEIRLRALGDQVGCFSCLEPHLLVPGHMADSLFPYELPGSLAVLHIQADDSGGENTPQPVFLCVPEKHYHVHGLPEGFVRDLSRVEPRSIHHELFAYRDILCIQETDLLRLVVPEGAPPLEIIGMVFENRALLELRNRCSGDLHLHGRGGGEPVPCRHRSMHVSCNQLQLSILVGGTAPVFDSCPTAEVRGTLVRMDQQNVIGRPVHAARQIRDLQLLRLLHAVGIAPCQRGLCHKVVRQTREDPESRMAQVNLVPNSKDLIFVVAQEGCRRLFFSIVGLVP